MTKYTFYIFLCKLNSISCIIFLYHEVKHIVNDLPDIGYIIGVDMQHEQFEKVAVNAIIYVG